MRVKPVSGVQTISVTLAQEVAETWFINLDRREDRRLRMHRRLAAAGLRGRRFPAIDWRSVPLCEPGWSRVEQREATSAEVACSLSHRALWERCVTVGRPLLILEDDTWFRRDLADRWQRPLVVPADVDLLHLGPSWFEPGERVGDVHRMRQGFGTHAYVLWPRGAGTLLARWRAITPDHELFLAADEAGLHIVVPSPFWAIQDDSASDLGHVASPARRFQSADLADFRDRRGAAMAALRSPSAAAEEIGWHVRRIVRLASRMREPGARLAGRIVEVATWLRWFLAGPVRASRLLPDLRLIARSGLFDRDYYVRHSDGTRASIRSPLLHFLLHGGAAGHRPSDLFDPTWYMAQLEPEPVGVSNPVVHYLRTGRARGLRPVSPHDFSALRTRVLASGMFDPRGYLRRNPDVAQAGLDPLDHFLFRGLSEGRDPSSLFDGRAYRHNYPDVRDAGCPPFYHFLLFGREEGRLPLPVDGHLRRAARGEARPEQSGIDAGRRTTGGPAVPRTGRITGTEA